MTQKRYDNFADDITAYDANQARSIMFDPAVLSGGIFSVVSNQLYMSAITVILPSGVLISEDTNQLIDLDSVPGSSSITYTIAYTHDDQNIIHGTAAAITVYTGLVSQSSLTNGTILGWVNYPGGGVPLSINHVIQSRSGKVAVNVSKNDIVNLGVSLPPFANKFLSYSSTGAVITISDICDISNPSLVQSYVEFYNPSSSISGNVIKVLPFMTGSYKPSLISLELYADLDADVTVTVIDSTGVEISPTNNTITNTSIFITRDLSWLPDYSLFADRSVFLVKLNITLDPLKKVRFKSIGYSTYNLPF